ncbi:MAG: 2-oxo acid dehydrogenase subunit E2 [Spirochaetia bacterium]
MPPAQILLTLAFDHRCADGAQGGHFLGAFKDL